MPKVLSTVKLNTAKAFIARQLLEVKTGDTLPSIRDMVRNSGTSRTAVMQALEHYKNSGEVEVKPRSGIVKSESPKGQPIFDLIACHEFRYSAFKGGYLHYLIQVLTDVLSQKHYGIRLHRVKSGENLNSYTMLADLKDNTGFILLVPKIREIVTTFEATGKPVVSIHPQTPLDNCFQVIDSSDRTRKELEYLISMGHSRIAIFTRKQLPREYTESATVRQLEYFKVMAEHGFKVYPHWCVHYDQNDEKSMLNTLNSIFGRKPRPTAFIVPDSELPYVYRYLENNGMEVGKDVSVMATDGFMVCRHVFPPAATIVNPVNEAVEFAWEMLEQQLNGDFRPLTREIRVSLHKDKSVGPPPTEKIIKHKIGGII